MLSSLLAAMLLFSASLGAGFGAGPALSAGTLEELARLIEPIAGLGPLGVFAFIFLNNAIKTLAVIVLGTCFGLPSLFFISFNGFILGTVISALRSEVGWGLIAASLAPHGVIEIPVVMLATALGLGVGWESLRWLARRRSRVGRRLRGGLRLYLRWLLPGLAVAAAVEVVVTPLVIGLAGGGAVP